MNAIKRFKADETGAAMVEFALVFAFLFLPLMFGAIEFGRGTFAKQTVTAAAREGVRYAAVHGEKSGATLADTAVIRAYIEGRTALAPIAVTTTYDPAGSLQPGSFVQVRVSYNYTPVMGTFSARIGGRTVTIPFLSARTITSTSKQIVHY